jgi:hypothetical protein
LCTLIFFYLHFIALGYGRCLCTVIILIVSDPCKDRWTPRMKAEEEQHKILHITFSVSFWWRLFTQMYSTILKRLHAYLLNHVGAHGAILYYRNSGLHSLYLNYCYWEIDPLDNTVSDCFCSSKSVRPPCIAAAGEMRYPISPDCWSSWDNWREGLDRVTRSWS